METKNLSENFKGCLVGKALGDSLGFVVEGANQEFCTKYVEENLIPLIIPPSKGDRFFKFGQYSDDTQLARELAISIVENNGFKVEAYARKIANIFETERIVGRGHATSSSALRLIQGVSWKESGEPGPYAGNGTAMRVAPIGLFYNNDYEKLEKYCIEQSIITHKDERCSAGAYIVALTISYVMNNKTFRNEDLIEFLLDKLKEKSSIFADELENLMGWIDLDFATALDFISKSGKPELKSDFWDKISPYVVPTVIWALYSFLNNKNSYLDSVSYSIKAGGDVDTTAAITGSISGAYLGETAIPKVYSQLVEDNGQWGYKDLVNLADQLYKAYKSQ